MIYITKIGISYEIGYIFHRQNEMFFGYALDGLQVQNGKNDVGQEIECPRGIFC